MAGATQFCPSDLCQGDEKTADNTSLLARALKMHRCKSVGQNRHVSLPCMPHELREVRMLSLRQNKNSSFPGHAPGKDTLRAANAATERGQTGENARANAVSRRALSPVLPKEGVNGGENARASVLRSEGVCSPVIFCRYSSAISPVPTAYRSHRVFFLMKNPLCSCMYTPPQSKAVHP